MVSSVTCISTLLLHVFFHLDCKFVGCIFVFEPTQKDWQLHPKEEEGVLWYILKKFLGFRKYQ